MEYDYVTRMQDERVESRLAFNEWVDDNEKKIIERYTEDFLEFPKEIYEGVLDDDYQDAEERYLMELTIDDVPDGFIDNLYEVGL